MAWFKRVFDFYLDASIHVAFAVLSLMYITALTVNINVDFHLYCFVFFGTIGCYNFVKYGVEAHKYILVANRYHKNIQFFSIICTLIAIYHSLFLSKQVFMGLLVLGGITALYALPVLPRHRNFRSLSGFKILIVALVWAGTTVILPVYSETSQIDYDIQLETVQRFLLVLVLLVPFEIRDLKYDHSDLKTLPQRLGVVGARRIGYVWVLLFYTITFLKSNVEPTLIISNTVFGLLLLLALYRSKKNQSKYYASFWVEALPIIWWTIVVLLNKTTNSL
ncbi:hypothetical protein Q2T41_12895 [Maribacter confluentis]|uniref:Prenyltransferase n=1 Tax=Maribacter confluentis TaxID=1656093 RepID=A0ABT8RSR9_9FLAO|nr:hypothetical protein [Maribacter confluentis]MDO1513552.1 hypothetical protein [Maribacter confluentis]